MGRFSRCILLPNKMILDINQECTLFRCMLHQLYHCKVCKCPGKLMRGLFTVGRMVSDKVQYLLKYCVHIKFVIVDYCIQPNSAEKLKIKSAGCGDLTVRVLFLWLVVKGKTLFNGTCTYSNRAWCTITEIFLVWEFGMNAREKTGLASFCETHIKRFRLPRIT